MRTYNSQMRAKACVVAVVVCVFARLLWGSVVDPAIALVGFGLCIWRGAPVSRPVLFWLAMAVYAAAQTVVARPAGVAPWQIPDWAVSYIGEVQSQWSLAPWETVRYVLLFGGAACWSSALLDRDLRGRRFAGNVLRGFGVVVAAWAIYQRLSGWSVEIGENHVGILLVMLLCEPARRMRTAGLQVWLAGLVMTVGIVAAGAVAPVVLGAAVMLWGLQPLRVSEQRRAPKLMLACVVLLTALLAGLVAQYIDTPRIGFSGRVAIWRDVWAMLADALPFGIGFGSFHWVYPAYAEHLAKPALRALHPENAYLWLLCEGGVVAVLLLGIWIGGGKHRGRAAAAARFALMMLAIECLIEVPILWGPIFWLLPLWITQAYRWRDEAKTGAEIGQTP